MKTREDLQNSLEEICEHVYFRKPSKNMIYPCILYNLVGRSVDYADDLMYKKRNRWSLTVMDEDPDSEIPEEIEEKFTYCSLDRTYQADNLNHFVYRLYF